MTDTAQPLTRNREDTDEAPAIAASGGPSIRPVRRVLRAVVTWLCASPASTYVFISPPYDADARGARIRRAQGAVHELFEPPDPYDTWKRLW
jgi:hypothetical protein